MPDLREVVQYSADLRGATVVRVSTFSSNGHALRRAADSMAVVLRATLSDPRPCLVRRGVGSIRVSDFA